jgi:nitrite reductase/ring-hydroxylating ferredoxin subunit
VTSIDQPVAVRRRIDISGLGAGTEAGLYQALLDTDSIAPPPVFRIQSPLRDDGPVRVPASRYTTAEFHRLEVEKIWKKAWQMACREEDIPEVGDHVVYDIVGISVLVTRSAPDTISAHHNVCRHRGRTLKDFPGRDTEYRCPFHGFAWNLDGSFKHAPCSWDFDHVDFDDFDLPPVRVDTWGGFVFVNPTPTARHSPTSSVTCRRTSSTGRWRTASSRSTSARCCAATGSSRKRRSWSRTTWSRPTRSSCRA